MSSVQTIPPPAVVCNVQDHHTKRYKVGRRLGEGGFATVYSVESLDSHRVYACKVINKCRVKRKEHQRKLVSEIKLHRTLNHHHIVRFHSHFDDTENVYILLEQCSHHSLMELSNKRKVLTEHEVRFWMKQIIVAIKYLHNKSIIHRDLKLSNVLLDEDLMVKLCDFGLATKVVDDERKTTICGTPNYIAPEILNGNHHGMGHSFEVDIWSLGVIMFTLLAGRPPFQTRNLHETYRRIKKMRYQWPLSRDISWMARDLISKIFTDPADRLNLSEVEGHDFFTKTPIPRRLPLSVLQSKPSSQMLFDSIHQSTAGRTDAVNSEAAMPSTESTTANPPVVAPNQNIYARGTMGRRPRPPPRATTTHSVPRQALISTARSNVPQKKVPPLTPKCKIKPTRNLKDRTSGHGPKDDSLSPPDPHCNVVPASLVYVVRHCDYSKKYGIGYLLSNGVTGTHFNDSTKITLHGDRQTVTYLDGEHQRARKCTMQQFPEALTKKVKLLQFFERHLWDSQKQNVEEVNVQREDDHGDPIYVTTLRKDRYAVAFKLSDGTLQVSFADNSKLVYRNSSTVMYQHRDGERTMHTLEEINQSEQRELRKRYRFMKMTIANIRR